MFENEEVYTIPEEIKAKFTDEFCKSMRRALFRIHGYYGLDTPAESGPIQNTSTGGYVVAFFTACVETDNEDLFVYWHNLPWYDSDIFDDMLITYMIDKGYLLGYMEDIITEKLKIQKENLRLCNCCGRYFTKDMGQVVVKSEEYSLDWLCNCCYEKEQGYEGQYYSEQYKKMREWIDQEEEHESTT